MTEFWIILATFTLSPIEARLGDCAYRQAVFDTKSEAVEAYKKWPRKESIRIFKAVEYDADFTSKGSTRIFSQEEFKHLLDAAERVGEQKANRAWLDISSGRCEAFYTDTQKSQCARKNGHSGKHTLHTDEEHIDADDFEGCRIRW